MKKYQVEYTKKIVEHFVDTVEANSIEEAEDKILDEDVFGTITVKEVEKV